MITGKRGFSDAMLYVRGSGDRSERYGVWHGMVGVECGAASTGGMTQGR
jgi:uncharacterized protein YgiB involved in biofilm formation